ncbi:MAG: type II methionyl aminopeptidase [Candidatus Pacearchaeota archaeon]
MEKKEFENYIKAGKIASEIREKAKKFIKKDMLLVEIAEFIEKSIEESGGKPAFPVNLSTNEIAAHYTPSIKDKKKAEGLLKVDFGVEIEGYIADLAFSLDLTHEKKFEEIINLNEEILKKTIDSLNYESKISDIGEKISELLKGKKFNIVKNLTGHTLQQYQIHASPSIPNIKTNDKTPLKEKAIAIEPFLTTGVGEVIESSPSEIFMLVDENKKPRNNESRKILDFIKKEYKTKPFCKRWLEKKAYKTIYLFFLEKENIIYNFPILIEKSKAPVSQTEETLIFFEEKKIIITSNILK